MSTWTVRLKFTNTRVQLPEEDAFLPGLPQKGDTWWTTKAFLDQDGSDELGDAVAWLIDGVDVILFAHHKHLALITLVPHPGTDDA